MVGFQVYCWLLCGISLLANSSTAWLDPDLIVVHKPSSGSRSDVSVDVSSLEHCKHQLSVCTQLNHLENEDDSMTRNIMNKMKVVVENWMFLAGMKNFELPRGDIKSVPLMMTLNDVDLKTINTYLEHPTYNNFLSTLVVLDRVFSAKTYKLGSSKLQDDGVPGSTLMESKERWVQIIFNIIMSCMNKETMLVVTSLILGLFLLKAMIFGADVRVLMSLFLAAVFFAGFLWNWCFMYQKAVVDQHVKRMRYEKFASRCTPDDSFWGSVKALFGYVATLDECTEYYRGLEIDPLIMVPPTQALSETITMLIIHPSILMAEAMQKITRILFGNMVWGIYFGTPLVMLIFGIMFITFFIILTGRRVRFKIIYLGSLEVGSQFENFYHRPGLTQGEDSVRSPTALPAPQRSTDETQTPTSGAQSSNQTDIPTGSASQPSHTSTSTTHTTSNANIHPSVSHTMPHTHYVPCTGLTPSCGLHSAVQQPQVLCQHSQVSSCFRNPCSSHFSFDSHGENCLSSRTARRNPRTKRNSDNTRIKFPLRDMTDLLANENSTEGWTGGNSRQDMEDFIYVRRRKLSY